MKPQSFSPVYTPIYIHTFRGIVPANCGQRPVAVLIMFSSSVTSHAQAIEHSPQNQ